MGLKLLTKLRLGLNHLNEHRFNHNFQSCINPLCSCSLAIESTTHFLLHCHHFSNIRSTLLNSINEVEGDMLQDHWKKLHFLSRTALCKPVLLIHCLIPHCLRNWGDLNHFSSQILTIVQGLSLQINILFA